MKGKIKEISPVVLKREPRTLESGKQILFITKDQTATTFLRMAQEDY